MNIVDVAQKKHPRMIIYWLLFVTCIFAAITPSFAHNKVVVVPLLGGDEVVASQPSTPLADADTNSSDYQLLFGDNPLLDALTARDRTTRLEWQRRDKFERANWNEAWTYCQDLELRNRFDWRLPTILELQSIVDYGNSGPAIEVSAFPSNENAYWSATTSSTSAQLAWLVRIGGPGEVNRQNKVNTQGVRCVR